MPASESLGMALALSGLAGAAAALAGEVRAVSPSPLSRSADPEVPRADTAVRAVTPAAQLTATERVAVVAPPPRPAIAAAPDARSIDALFAFGGEFGDQAPHRSGPVPSGDFIATATPNLGGLDGVAAGMTARLTPETAGTASGDLSPIADDTAPAVGGSPVANAAPAQNTGNTATAPGTTRLTPDVATPTPASFSSSTADQALWQAVNGAAAGHPTPRTAPPSGPSSPAGPLVSSAPGIVVVGPDVGSAPVVKVYDSTSHQLKFQFLAYAQSFTGGVRVAVGDLKGDGSWEIVTGQGPGGSSLVRVWDGTSGSLIRTFQPYAAGQTDGVFVAAGDVNGDGKADILTGTDVGSAPLVKVWNTATGTLLTSFLAGDPNTTGGVRVAAGDVNGDGKADILTGSGPGGPTRLDVYDGGTSRQLADFFPYGLTYTSGVYVAAGDLNRDGKADILAGPGGGMPAEVRAWRGPDLTPLGNVLAADASFTGAVRVAAGDVTGNGWAELLTAQGPGGGQARAFDGQLLTAGPTFSPYGQTYQGGLFLAASPAPGGAPGDPGGPTVTVVTSPAVTNDQGAPAGGFTISRTGSTTNPLTVYFTSGGTAVVGTDWNGFGANQAVIQSGHSNVSVAVVPKDDNAFDGPETVSLTLQSNANYVLGTPSSGIVEIIDGLPVVVPQQDCGCGGGGGADKLGQPAGLNANPVSEFGQAPVRLFDGMVKQGAAQLSSGGFGTGWGQDLSWTNGLGYANTSFAGVGSVVSELPYLQTAGNSIALISNGTTAHIWDSYHARYFGQDTLGDNTSTGEITITDTLGDVLKFYDLGSVPPTNSKGLFKSYADPDGNTTSVTSWSAAGYPAEVRRVSGSLIESYLYSYASSSPPLLSSVVLRRSTDGGSTWTTVRQVAYSYYTSNTTYGNTNDLKLVQVQDASGNTLDTYYARYYIDNTNGYVHGLKYFFGPQSYARLTAALGTGVDSLTDAQVAPYADRYYQYDSWQRVTQATLQGDGCSSCSGGLGTYSYSYTPSAFPDGYNNWRMKTVETLPDGNTNTTYANEYGEVLLSAFQDATSGSQWVTAYQYDTSGRLVQTTLPSAAPSYDETVAGLNVAPGYAYGQIILTDYGTTTTATSSTAGDVQGYLKDTKVQMSQPNSPGILQSQTQYFSQAQGSATVYPVANQAVYRNTDGTGAETTSYSYTYFSGTLQVQSVTVTKPTISSGQNGPGTGDVDATFNDTYGRPIWHKDPDGFLDYTAYDQATGAVTKTITDVDTTRTGDFQNLPSGWTTPSGGGLHLITQSVADGLGRTTQLTDPLGNVTYTVYKDTNYEVRTYPGWNSTTNVPTGPTVVSREDRPGSYLESLTMSATPHLTGGVPDGTESVANIQSLSRSYGNAAGQMVRSDSYFNLSGVTYSTSTYIGTQNTNYLTTLTDYDSRGRQNRVQLPTGTINRTVYDGLGRVISTWVGTNDTPGSGTWSPGNNTSPANMVETSSSAYDAGGQPNALSLSQTSGGSLAATTYYVRVAYVSSQGVIGAASLEGSLAVSANNLLQVASPTGGVPGNSYNVYAATQSGGEVLQNATPITVGTNWTEPTSGLVTGTAAPPASGTGDGLLTQAVQYPGGSAAIRVTQNYYDWRDRLVATKSGVQSSEDTTTHRPITFVTLDNLGETTQVQSYDGDGVTITSSGGVPQAPSASLLRAQTNTSYDDQGRVYLAQTYSVNPSTGAVSSTALTTNTWYDHRGNVLKTSSPGGLVSKSSYDGAGRVTVSYTTDGAGDSGWSSAGTVTGNNVLAQVETTYDKDGNAILTTTRQRFHDETATGALGNPTTAPKARVSYSADYYDLANRLTATVDVGTNGGTA